MSSLLQHFLFFQPRITVEMLIKTLFDELFSGTEFMENGKVPPVVLSLELHVFMNDFSELSQACVLLCWLFIHLRVQDKLILTDTITSPSSHHQTLSHQQLQWFLDNKSSEHLFFDPMTSCAFQKQNLCSLILILSKNLILPYFSKLSSILECLNR